MSIRDDLAKQMFRSDCRRVGGMGSDADVMWAVVEGIREVWGREADALLASPVVARIRAEAKAEALRDADEALRNRSPRYFPRNRGGYDEGWHAGYADGHDACAGLIAARALDQEAGRAGE